MPEHAFYSIIPHKVRVVNKIIVKLVKIREILMLGVGVWTAKGAKETKAKAAGLGPPWGTRRKLLAVDQAIDNQGEMGYTRYIKARSAYRRAGKVGYRIHTLPPRRLRRQV